MSITAERKKQLIAEYGRHPGDTGQFRHGPRPRDIRVQGTQGAAFHPDLDAARAEIRARLAQWLADR